MKLLATRKDEQNEAALDPWTVVHLGAGLALGLMDVDRDKAMGAALGYEAVEQYVERQAWGRDLFNTRRAESLANAAVDLAAFGVGYWLGTVWNRTG